MNPLCARCGGACCTTFLQYVGPNKNEAHRWVQIHGGIIHDTGHALFPLRCYYLDASGRCLIYSTRPECCRLYPVDGEQCRLTRQILDKI